MTAKRPTRSTASAEMSTDEQLARLSAWQGDAMNAATQASRAYAGGLAALSQELMTFAQSRWRHDMELGESLMRCRGWQDAADVHRDWLAETSREYIEETRKLFDLGSTVVRDSWGSMERMSPAAAEAKAGRTQP